MTDYPTEQIEALRPYCGKVIGLMEGRMYLLLEDLQLPNGCEPQKCDALLRPFNGADGYPSQLYFSVQVKSAFSRNWNVSNARICERNWFAFSWRVTLTAPRLVDILLAHLTGFTR
ncbi:MAG: hypothetical protein JWO71_710 [Candidatus Acidoferrum typicum]|nr:hypothetical protein [Candidatus Acidoferrum typicum]